MTAYLRRFSHQVSAGAVDRAMGDLGLQGSRRGRKVFTTVSDKTKTQAPHLVDRNFTATAPNELWVTDLGEMGLRTFNASLWGKVGLTLPDPCSHPLRVEVPTP